MVYRVVLFLWDLVRGLGGVFEVGALLAAVFVILFVIACAFYSLVVAATYGWYVLTLLLATVPFFLLNFVADWRWKAWDDQERWEFRNRGKRPLGRAWDAALWLWLVLAGGWLVVWIAVSQYSPEWSASA